MKNSLLILISFAFFTSSHAQGQLIFTEEHNVINDIDVLTDFDVEGNNYVVNTTDITRELRWTINIIEMTPGWEVALCDRNLCYLPSTTTYTFNAEPDTMNRMLLHAYPHGIEGLATVEITVVDEDDASLSTSQIYYFSSTTTNVDEALNQSAKIYPNPTSGQFTLKGTENKVDFIEVMNLGGQTLTSFKFNKYQEYNISKLPQGVYFIRLMDDNARVLSTKLLNKL